VESGSAALWNVKRVKTTAAEEEEEESKHELGSPMRGGPSEFTLGWRKPTKLQRFVVRPTED